MECVVLPALNLAVIVSFGSRMVHDDTRDTRHYAHLDACYVRDSRIGESFRSPPRRFLRIAAPMHSRDAHHVHVELIVSGGQTGADRASLDVAIRHGLPHGGWCPAGRRAEDGTLDARYQLTETADAAYEQRTKWNVRDSDGTVVFTMKPDATGGSLYTLQVAQELGRPALHLTRIEIRPAAVLRDFVVTHGIRRLNVAGSRESVEPGTYAWVEQVLEDALFGDTAAVQEPGAHQSR